MGNSFGIHDANIYRAWIDHTGTMTEYRSIKIPVPLADIIDGLIQGGEYSSRAEYVKEAIRNDLRKRGLLGGS